MRRIAFGNLVRIGMAALALGVGAMAGSCNLGGGGSGNGRGGPVTTNAAANADGGKPKMLADFEKPGGIGGVPEVTFLPRVLGASVEPFEVPATTAAATELAPPAPVVLRSSVRPQAGLWSELANVGKAGTPGAGGGTISRAMDGGSVDVSAYNVVTAQMMELAGAGAGGSWIAAIVLTDVKGARVVGDSFAVGGQWDEIQMDLNWARDEGLDVAHVAAMGVIVQPVGGDVAGGDGLQIQTDTWLAESRRKKDVGSRSGKRGSFFVEEEGSRLRVGSVDQFEMTFWDQGIFVREKPAGGAAQVAAGERISPHAWMEILTGRGDGVERMVLGQPGTGLMLLDTDAMDGLRTASALQRAADDLKDAKIGTLPEQGWPIRGVAECRWTWRVVWASTMGAVVEVIQEAGPYDRQGEPAAKVTWRMMIYQWGQVYVHTEWTRGGTSGSGPVSWALVTEEGMLDRSMDTVALGGNSPADAERLLAEIYPASVREGLQTALPHAMQSGGPVAFIGETLAAGGGMAKDGWWWGRAKTKGPEGSIMTLGVKKVVGAGIGAAGGNGGRADCMLALGAPDVLRKAGTFGQYLVPPKVVVKQGELDRNFPGDVDNDGFVESYGFQVIRLENGRATFTIYPQGRPLFYPAYLFTVPAVEQVRGGGALDLTKFRVLINIDGKQFEDPPQWPDGSFLLQVPYGLDKPVTLEAVLEKR